MSRIGRMPISIPAGVTVEVNDNVVTVKGPKGELRQSILKPIEVNVDGAVATVTRPDDKKENRALHGLYRQLVANMVKGVSEGFKKHLLFNGVGYKAQKNGNKVTMQIGFSHPVEVEEPEGITFEVITQEGKNLGIEYKFEIIVSGIDKTAVGQAAAAIKAIKKIGVYKEHPYGIRYRDEAIDLKEGKKASK